MSKLLDSKSLLAKLMATEDIMVEQRKVSTAYFDLKNRVLCLPILKSDLESYNYDHFIGHEVGHARYTPVEKYREAAKKTVASILNCVEDVRIERKIKYKYPGLKNSFIKSYKDLIERDFFGTKEKDINEFNFIDRANLYFKGGPDQGIEFTDEEEVYLEMMESAETFEDVVEVTNKIVGFMKASAKEELRTIKVVVPPSVDDELEESEQPQGSPNPEEDEPEDNQTQEKTQASEEDGENTEEKSTTPDSGAQVEEEKEPTEEEILDHIQSKTDEAYKFNEKQLFEESNYREIKYVNIPEVVLSKTIMPFDDLHSKLQESINSNDSAKAFFKIGATSYMEYRKDLNRMVSYLVKEFELRKNADQMKRAQTSKTGELNMSKIYSYKFSEDIFKKITVMPDGKSHGLVLFLDWSGSMRNNIENTCKQLLALVLFCKKVNIPYEVYAFGDGNIEHSYLPITAVPKEGDLEIGQFTLYNIFSSRMNAAQFKFMASCFSHKNPYYIVGRVMDMSGTPLNEAIIAAMKIVPEFQQKYKLQIVNTVILTDGESNSNDSIYEKNTDRLYPRPFGGSDIVFRDPKSRIEEKVELQKANYNRGIAKTQTLICMLKRKTNCNVIGFYLVSPRHIDRAYRFYGNGSVGSKNYEETKNQFRNEKHVVLETHGFDEYYLLRDDSITADSIDFEDVEVKNNTARSIVSSFKKFNKNRLESRVVLNRFINLIA